MRQQKKEKADWNQLTRIKIKKKPGLETKESLQFNQMYTDRRNRLEIQTTET